MKKQHFRLLIAGLSSSSVFAATYLWYQYSQDQVTHRGNEKPLAYIGEVMNDIQRRPASQLLWQLVNSGEPLYDGEAIRTNEKGEVRILFANSERYLDLEPESLIVIKKSQGEIALDLMEGSLFVNATNPADSKEKAPNLVINSANGKVDLSQASAALSVGKGSNIDVQILEGKASIKNERGQSQELKSKSDIKVIFPTLNKPIAINTESSEPVQFQWQGFPSNAKVSLWLGANRKDLKEVVKVPEGKVSLATNLNLGRYFWKLVGTSPSGEILAESPLFKSDVIGRYPPTIIFPTADEIIQNNSGSYDLNLTWQNGEESIGTLLELSKDALLTQKIVNKTFTQEEGYGVSKLPPGTYYWRLSSYYKDSKKPIIGKIQKFTIQTQSAPPLVKMDLPPPTLPLEVQFTIAKDEMTQFYVNRPQVGISWQAKNADQVTSWRVKIAEENTDLSTAPAQETKETKFSQIVTRPGRYIAAIEALDKNGKTINTAKSEVVTVKPLPLLKSPSIIADTETVQAASDGTTELRWNKIEGAKEYVISVKKEGAEVTKNKLTANFMAFKNLLPGEYDIEIQAIDAYGRPSAPGPAKKLVVPDLSDVKAPTLKKIKVN